MWYWPGEGAEINSATIFRWHRLEQPHLAVFDYDLQLPTDVVIGESCDDSGSYRNLLHLFIKTPAQKLKRRQIKLIKGAGKMLATICRSNFTGRPRFRLESPAQSNYDQRENTNIFRDRRTD